MTETQDGRTTAPPTPPPGTDDSRLRFPFVGREAELLRLGSGLAEARRGVPRIMLVCGGAGTGKSRLVSEFIDREVQPPWVVGLGRCSSREGSPPYWVWTQALRTLCAAAGTAGVEPEDAAVIARSMPRVLRAPRPAIELAHLEAPAARFRLFEAVTQLLVAQAQRVPVVIALEDIHWADTPSLLLLEFVAQEAAACPLFIIATVRDDEAGSRPELARVLGELSRVERAERMDVGGLDAVAIGRMVGAAAGGTPPPQLVERLAAHTEGTPFFVTEVLRWLTTQGLLGPDAPPVSGRLPIPAGVEELIRSRLDTLSPETRELIAGASVIGRVLRLGMLSTATGVSEEQAARAVDEALASRILLRWVDDGAYAFSHSLIREALYRSLGETRRLELHRRVGTALDQLPEPEREAALADLAHHWCQAASAGRTEDLHRAVLHARSAGDVATHQLAFEQAIGLYDAALGIESRLSEDPRRRSELLLALGRVQNRAGQSEVAQRTLLAAAASARRAGSAELLADAALSYRLGTVAGWEFAGGDARLVALLEEALERLPETDANRRGRLQARLAVEIHGNPDRQRALIDHSIEMARRTQDPYARAEALCVRQIVTWRPDHAAAQAAAGVEIVRLAIESGNPEAEIQARHWRIPDLLTLADIDRVDAELRACDLIAERLRQPLYTWWQRYLGAMRLLLEGRLEAAEAVSAEAYGLGAGVKAANSEQVFGAQLLMIRWLQGRLAELRGPVADFRARYPGVAVWRCSAAYIMANTGEHREASTLLRELAPRRFSAVPRDTAWLACITMLADVSATVADRAAASTLYELLLPFGDKAINVGPAALCYGPAARPLARLALLRGECDVAMEHAQQSLGVAERLGSPVWRAFAHAGLAEVLEARDRPGDRAEAERRHGECARIAAEWNIALLTAAAEARAGHRRVSLSERERRVARLAVTGLSAREIGEQLFISKRTVETHLERIYEKLGVSGRIGLVRLAERGDPDLTEGRPGA